MDTIKVLGVVGHSETNRLLFNVQQALDNLNLLMQPVVIDDVAQLMEWRIVGIPALVVRGQVVSQHNVPAVPDLQYFFQSAFLLKKKPSS